MYEVMIIDDDVQILDMVELVLKREGFATIRALNAFEAFRKLETANPDLFLIDAILPEMDGISVCRRLRALPHTAHTPVIFLTGVGATDMMVNALASGADDYVRKPFAARELIARVRALIRRSVYYSDSDAPQIRIDSRSGRVFVNDREILLTRMEYDLMLYLCRAPYHLHSAEDLLENVWRYPGGVGDAALVRNHIHNIRRKIEADPERPAILQSRHGRGYVVKARVQVDNDVPAPVFSSRNA